MLSVANVLSTSCHHGQHLGQQLSSTVFEKYLRSMDCGMESRRPTAEDLPAGRVSDVSESMGLAHFGESTESLLS